jgi:hypothetical protein
MAMTAQIARWNFWYTLEIVGWQHAVSAGLTII